MSPEAGLALKWKRGWRKQRRTDSGSQDPITPVLFIINLRIIVVIMLMKHHEHGSPMVSSAMYCFHMHGIAMYPPIRHLLAAISLLL